MNVILPSGVTPPPPNAAAVAVSVTLCPGKDGFALEATLVEVPSSTSCISGGLGCPYPFGSVELELVCPGSPLYDAVIGCFPTASIAVELTAVAVVAAPPSATPDASVVDPSRKVTVPVRLPALAPVVPVAVKVTPWPKPDGFRLDATVVVVELTAVASPTISIASGEFTVSPALPTLMIPATGLPATIGANTTPAAQSPATASGGLPIVQVVVAASSAVFAPGLIAVISSAAFPSFSIVWLIAADLSNCRTGVATPSTATFPSTSLTTMLSVSATNRLPFPSNASPVGP